MNLIDITTDEVEKHMAWSEGVLTEPQNMEIRYLKDEDGSVSQAVSCDEDDLQSETKNTVPSVQE